MYKQDKHPFPVTSCGRRRNYMMSPLNASNEPRKTTKGKGRNFRTTEEGAGMTRSEEHTSELQSQSTISYADLCLKKKKTTKKNTKKDNTQLTVEPRRNKTSDNT